MPTEEKDKSQKSTSHHKGSKKTASGERRSKKVPRKTKGKKEETYEDKNKTYKFRVQRASASGDKLSAELARQQFAALQAERDKTEREKKEEQKTQKEQMDALRAEAERERKQAEKFSKSYEPTMLNILELYRSLEKDPGSFVLEQEKMNDNISSFTDVLTTVGMNPEVARIKATEAALQDLLEKRNLSHQLESEHNKYLKDQLYKTLVKEEWPDAVAKRLADKKVDLNTTLKPEEVVKRTILLNQIKELIFDEYKKRGWTEEEIRAKASYGIDVNNLNFTKPTKFSDGTPVSQPMVEESVQEAEKKVESPLPSGSTGPPPLFPQPIEPPLPRQETFEFLPPEEKKAEEKPISIRKPKPPEPSASQEEIDEWNSFWSSFPNREEKQEYPIVPPVFKPKEFPSFPNIPQESKSLSDLSVIPLLPVQKPIPSIKKKPTSEPKKSESTLTFPAPYPPIAPVAPSVAEVPSLFTSAPPFSQESLTATTKVTKQKINEGAGTSGTTIAEQKKQHEPTRYEPRKKNDNALYPPIIYYGQQEQFVPYQQEQVRPYEVPPFDFDHLAGKKRTQEFKERPAIVQSRTSGDEPPLPPAFQFNAPFQPPESMVFDIGNPFGSY